MAQLLCEVACDVESVKSDARLLRTLEVLGVLVRYTPEVPVSQAVPVRLTNDVIPTTWRFISLQAEPNWVVSRVSNSSRNLEIFR